MKVQRRVVADILVRDGETAVMVTGRVVRLSELSSLIFALTGEPIEIDELATELESRLGAPDGRTSVDLTKDAVTELIRHGVLRPSEQHAD